MNSKSTPNYAILGNTSSRTSSKTPLLRRIANWIRNFLENAE